MKMPNEIEELDPYSERYEYGEEDLWFNIPNLPEENAIQHYVNMLPIYGDDGFDYPYE